MTLLRSTGATRVLAVILLLLLPRAHSFGLSSIPQKKHQQRQWHHLSRLSMTTESPEHNSNNINDRNQSPRRTFLTTTTAGAAASLLFLAELAHPAPALARLEAVNRPDLLPTEPDQNVIQVEKFLTGGQARRMNDMLTNLEKDTGFRIRVLCQSYPNTPGLAIRDYWDLGKEGAKDDKYVVLVVDEFGGKGNVLNFNVGDGMKFALPNVFWTRLQGKYGTKFYVKENGIDLSIVNAIEAITTCLRSPEQFCVNLPEEGVNMKSLGF